MKRAQVLIAIPVFNARDATARCLESLIATRIEIAHRMLIINDASSDSSVAPMLDAFSRTHPNRAIEVRHNAVNRGFTWNANQAIAALRPDEHLLLLNSDALVTDGWLDEMVTTAMSDAAIGTVTPFSNNATICSFPDFSRAWPVPSAAERARMAKTLANARVAAIEIPTAIGFCMLIKRACVDAVGAFDVTNFPRGYGEENDYCRRAVNKGFRNVLCANSYVAHEGSQSFSAERHDLIRTGSERLLALHPDYNDVVADWIARDPAKARREAVRSVCGIE